MAEIYLDNAATTKVHEDIARIAVEVMCQKYGNPSSLHTKGLEAELVVNKAREQIAASLKASPEEIYFTSGGTEASNLALIGASAALKRKGKTILTTSVEHPSILNTLAYLETQGYQVHHIPPKPDGSLDVDGLIEAVNEDTILISAMLVNSEVGSISDISTATRRAKEKNSSLLFHCDAVQGFGKLEFSCKGLGVDLLTISGHKIHAPKGIGALWVKKGVRIIPQSYGGGQENGLRSGTPSTPLIAAFGAAAKEAALLQTGRYELVSAIAARFQKYALSIPGIVLHSSPEGSPYIQNISVLGYRSETMLHFLEERGVSVSSGSACTKGAKSHVLKAMQLPDSEIDSALRISFSFDSMPQEVDTFFELLVIAMDSLIRSE